MVDSDMKLQAELLWATITRSLLFVRSYILFSKSNNTAPWYIDFIYSDQYGNVIIDSQEGEKS